MSASSYEFRRHGSLRQRRKNRRVPDLFCSGSLFTLGSTCVNLDDSQCHPQSKIGSNWELMAAETAYRLDGSQRAVAFLQVFAESLLCKASFFEQ